MERRRVSVDEGYSKWAASYDAFENGLIILEEPLIRELIGDVRGKRVLDAGCGTGRHARWMAAAGGRVQAVDPTDAMRAIAEERCRGLDVDVARGDLTSLPDGPFDVVLCALMLEHVADLGAAVAELAKRVGAGGALVVSVYHPFFLLKGVPPHFLHADGVEYELPAHVHLPSDYLRALRLSGLALEEFLEPLVDAALVARLPNFAKHEGHPLAILLRARRA
jgi:2-polyprenyl-3-methyl-5-hydroxy-6-metoxy-1,4-benzoquinol methylase